MHICPQLAFVMKRVWIFLLSLLLIYGGVAWAVEACLRHDQHLHHELSEHRFSSQAAETGDESYDRSLPVIHCAPISQHVGPAARAASIEIPRSDATIALHPASLPNALSTLASNENLWLEALFKKLVTFSPPIDLARHLFLSVLQI